MGYWSDWRDRAPERSIVAQKVGLVWPRESPLTTNFGDGDLLAWQAKNVASLAPVLFSFLFFFLFFSFSFELRDHMA